MPMTLRPAASTRRTSSRRSAVNGHASSPSSSQTLPPQQKENIFLFVPNLIGYSRIVLALISLYYMPLHPRTCCLLYTISCLLDAVDGYAARLLQQSTKFGAVLDMVTDRCTTTCLLVFLAGAFPRWSIVFQLLISLDLSSHYMHMYATLTMGESGQSHKKIDSDAPSILKLYYSDTRVLFVLCALNELFFIALYLLSFSSPYLSPHILDPMPAGGLKKDSSAALKYLFTAPWSAGAMELARANKMDSRGPWWLAGVSLLFMLVKQYINVRQLLHASRWLAQGDIEARLNASPLATSSASSSKSSTSSSSKSR